jgi:2-polyprenyl-3-methyl-5-hydroxy-6-metoxy-1,4-benzoquinol methylase
MRQQCWCGNATLQPFGADYLLCDACQTLVFAGQPAQADPRVRDDASDFYGWEYFHSFQHDRNQYPDIQTRARTDLPERCAYWLNALTKFKLPPAKVLELGSAHGGFVALLRQAGFDATGLDLSPAIVDFATRTFGVPMLTGPVEDQAIDPGSLDAIALMDVIEHMPDPVASMRHCLSLLKPDGVMLIQTPGYPAGKTFDEITSSGDRFAQQFRPGEHLHLFSQRSLALLFERLGAKHVNFLPPIFWFYDQFAVVSRAPIVETTEQSRESAMSQTTGRRVVQALMDGEDRFRDLLDKHRALIAENARLKAELLAVRSGSRHTMAA